VSSNEDNQKIDPRAVVGGIFFFSFLFFGLPLMMGPSQQGDTKNNDPSNKSSTKDQKNSPAFKMSVVFSGEPPTREVRSKIEQTIQSYDLPSNDEQKMKIGDILLTLRKKYGVSEMDIIVCVNVSSANFNSFKKAAAKCVARLEN
jgi:hypothetical protein